MTIAEMLVKQGRQEGRQEGIEEGRLAILEKAVRAGASWSLIESAADGDSEILQALRQRLAAAGDSADVHTNGADQPDPPG